FAAQCKIFAELAVDVVPFGSERQHKNDLVLSVDLRVVVVVDLRRGDSEARKHDASAKISGGVAAYGEVERYIIFTQPELNLTGLFPGCLAGRCCKAVAVAEFDSGYKLEGLKVSVAVSGLQPVCFEPRRYIFGGKIVSGSAGPTALQFIRSEVFDMPGKLFRAHRRR